jgi:hypothetical protein
MAARSGSLWERLGVALGAEEKLGEMGASALFGCDPGTHLPGRPMADMLGVAAGEIGHPISKFVLMKADDGSRGSLRVHVLPA